KRLLLPNKTKKPNDRHRQDRHLPPPCLRSTRIAARQRIQRLACKLILIDLEISRYAARPISKITKSALRAKKKRRSNTQTAPCSKGWWRLLIILSLVSKPQKGNANSLRFIPE